MARVAVRAVRRLAGPCEGKGDIGRRERRAVVKRDIAPEREFPGRIVHGFPGAREARDEAALGIEGEQIVVEVVVHLHIRIEVVIMGIERGRFRADADAEIRGVGTRGQRQGDRHGHADYSSDHFSPSFFYV